MDNIQQHNNEFITSFANPNYTLNHTDTLNSNFFPPDTGDGSSSSSLLDELTLCHHGDDDSQSLQNYFDPCSLPVAEDEEEETRNESWRSPADSEGHFSMESSATTPGERAESIVEVQHSLSMDSDMSSSGVTDADDRPSGKSGFTGFYTSITPVMSKKNMKGAPAGGTCKESREDRAETETDKPKHKVVTRLSGQDGAATPGTDSNDSGIQADLAAPQQSSAEPSLGDRSPAAAASDEQLGLEDADVGAGATLPSGWQQCTDEEGPYYWHIKSGTIQRKPPSPGDAVETQPSAVLPVVPGEIPSVTSQDFSQIVATSAEKLSASLTSPLSNDQPSKPKEPVKEVREPIPSLRYAVRSLGWVPIAEEDLTQERSSRAVNKCIVDLSLGRNDINDGVGRWGDGKDLFLELDQENLTLLDTVDLSVLNVQPVQSIRVWGVGRDNGRERDFAYVARDRASKRYMCHVFRCDTPARQIANNLRDICQRIVMQRNLHHPSANQAKSHKSQAKRPKNLPNLEKTNESSQETLQRLLQLTSFPTPMEEPKKVISCHYLGTLTVTKPTGIDVLNNAMEKVYSQVPPEEWNFVNVAVAPSTITISEHTNEENIVAECRVRFLSFMGIAQRNVKLCSFIMHTAQDDFLAHVFHSEPSAGALCKTIEAACKLRYQKCLDAHQKQMAAERFEAGPSQSKGLGASIKHGMQSVLGSISRSRKPKS